MSQVKVLIVLHCCHNYLEDYVQIRGMVLINLQNCAPFGTMHHLPQSQKTTFFGGDLEDREIVFQNYSFHALPL